MKILRAAAAILSVALVFPPVLAGQWPLHPAPGVPRTPDGKADPNGPVPRTAAGRPDLTGVWAFLRETPRLDLGIGGAGGTPLPDGTVPNVLGQFWDIAFGMKEPLPFQPWAAELRRKRIAANNQDNPDARCLPIGFMQLHTHPQPRKVVHTPSLIVIMYEANFGLRQIFLDGRALPSSSDLQPWWYGYSIGRWDGDTLVVETSGLKDDGWLDVIGSPFTDSAKVTERFRRVNFGSLEIDITVDDPKAYTRPWSVTVKQRLMPDNDLMEFICNENEKSSSHFVR